MAADTEETPPDLGDSGGGESCKCAVCGEISNRFYVNYGAEACFSCRAFFRRANQPIVSRKKNSRTDFGDMLLKVRFVCKGNGDCKITPKNRNCRWCRYKACLLAGMQEDKVLNDSDKKKRFWKVIKRKIDESEGSQEPQEVAVSTEVVTMGVPTTTMANPRAKPWERMVMSLDKDSMYTPPTKKRGRKPKNPTLRAQQGQQRQGEWPREIPLLVVDQESASQAWQRHQALYQQLEQQQQQQQQELPISTPSSYPRHALQPDMQQAYHGRFTGSAGHYSAGSQAPTYYTGGSVSNPFCSPMDLTFPRAGSPGNEEEQVIQPAQAEKEGEGDNSLGDLAKPKNEPMVVVVDQEESAAPKKEVQKKKKNKKNEVFETFKRCLLQGEADQQEVLPKVLEGSPLSVEDKTSEVNESSKDGTYSIGFRSQSKPEIFFRFHKRPQADGDHHQSTKSKKKPRLANNLRIRKEMLQFNKHCQRAWKVAVQGSSVKQEVEDAFRGFHAGFNTMNKSILKVHLISLAKVFAEFAMQQPFFESLSLEDKSVLLHRNTPLFIQYLMGRYFCAKDGREQFRWILLEPDPDEEVPFMTAADFNKAVGIFKEEGDFDCYAKLGAFLEGMPCLTAKCTYMVALCCLYSSSFATYLKRPKVVENQLNDTYNFAGWMSEVFGTPGHGELMKLMHQLAKLETFFDSRAIWEEGEETSLQQVLHLPAMSYTTEEESWLQNQFRRFNCTFMSLPLGEDLLREFLMSSCIGEPVGKSCMPRALAIFAERFKMILRGFDEFGEMSVTDQAESLQCSSMYALALFSVGMENCKSGLEQAGLAMGYFDDRVICEKFADLVDRRTFNVVRMRDVNQESMNLLSADMIKRFDEIHMNLAEIVSDKESYKLMMLILMLEGSRSKLRNLQHKYMLLLRRRLRKDEEEHSYLEEESTEEDLYEKFRGGLGDIKEMSKILKMILMARPPQKAIDVGHEA